MLKLSLGLVRLHPWGLGFRCRTKIENQELRLESRKSLEISLLSLFAARLKHDSAARVALGRFFLRYTEQLRNIRVVEKSQ